MTDRMSNIWDTITQRTQDVVDEVTRPKSAPLRTFMVVTPDGSDLEIQAHHFLIHDGLLHLMIDGVTVAAFYQWQYILTCQDAEH